MKMVEQSASECSEMDSQSEAEPDQIIEPGENDGSEPSAPKKKKKRGIIYLSTIPKYMNVSILREMLGKYATVGRVFLQPEKLSGMCPHEAIQNEENHLIRVMFQMSTRRRKNESGRRVTSPRAGLSSRANGLPSYWPPN